MKGEFETIIQNKNKGIKTKFIVVRGPIDNLPLISRDRSIEQSMMTLEQTGNLKETNELKIKRKNRINEPKSTKKKTKKKRIGEYEDVLQGMGNIKEPKT